MNLVDCEAIRPAMFRKAHQIRDFLIKLLLDKKNIKMDFYYRTDIPNDKKIKILDMNGYYSDLDVLYKSLLLLID